LPETIALCEACGCSAEVCAEEEVEDCEMLYVLKITRRI